MQGLQVAPERTTVVINLETKEERLHSESLKSKDEMKPRQVVHAWIGETCFTGSPLIQSTSVVEISVKLIVPTGDKTPVAIADSGASHLILPSSALQPGESHHQNRAPSGPSLLEPRVFF